jgi:tetraacyldisaccharide 4'-kinase
MPLGNLREKLKHLRRAEIIIYTRSEDESSKKITDEASSENPANTFNCVFGVESIVDTNLRPVSEVEMLKDKSCVAFAAIAKPDQFRRTLQSRHICLDKFIAFPDHHFYTEADHLHLAEEMKKCQSDYLVTTEKDLVRINPIYLKEFKLVGIRRAGHLENTTQFMNKLKEYIDFKS